MSGAAIDGLVVVDKPSGPTSHDVVAAVRRRLGVKAGHAGTLDPQATGVLLVCVGAATRLARFLQRHDKVYVATVRLGWATTTYDAEGEPLADPVAPPPLDEGRVRRALDAFVGEIEQVPPAYSAKKMRGVPAYRRARRGEGVEPDPIRVVVHDSELLSLEPERLRLRIHCGAGTYVRTLAHDLGRRLGCPAHLEALRRERSGPFGLAGAVEGASVGDMPVERLHAAVLPPAEMLPGWPAGVVDEAGARAVAHGNVVEPALVVRRLAGEAGREWPAGAADDEGPWVRILAESGDLLAAAEVRPGGVLQPRVVLVSAS